MSAAPPGSGLPGAHVFGDALLMDALCVFASPCRVASRGSWQTCRRPAATTAATARRNETDRTAAHAQKGSVLSLLILVLEGFLMIKLEVFSCGGGLLLVAVACCLLRHDVHDQPSSIIGCCWISSVLYCNNWILCRLFCAITVHSSFLQGSGASVEYYLKTCLEFKHDSQMYCVATLGQMISSLYICV